MAVGGVAREKILALRGCLSAIRSVAERGRSDLQLWSGGWAGRAAQWA